MPGMNNVATIAPMKRGLKVPQMRSALQHVATIAAMKRGLKDVWSPFAISHLNHCRDEKRSSEWIMTAIEFPWSSLKRPIRQ